MKESWRFFIAILLAFLILYIFNLFFLPPEKPSPQKPSPVTEVKKEPGITKPSPPKDTVVVEKPLHITSIQNEKLKVTIAITESSESVYIKNGFLKEYSVNLLSEPGISISIPLLKDHPFKVDSFKNGLKIQWLIDTFAYTFSIVLDTLPYLLRLSSNPPMFVDISCKGGLNFTEGEKGESEYFRIFYKDAKEFKSLAHKNLKNWKGKESKFNFVGLKNKYFLVSVLNREGLTGELNGWGKDDKRIALSFSVNPLAHAHLLIAPLDYDILTPLHVGLEKTIDLGASWYRFISVGVLKLFKLFYSLVKNYGLAIIVFAVIMKLAFFPFTRIQHKSMRRMQQIQPKIKEIQAQYKNDPKRMHQEMMNIYRIYKVNPFSGCLPMLIQMPIFFALYSVLRNAVELRKTALINLFTIGDKTWLIDLSLKDPFYILPIAMGVISLIQSLISNPNPQQRFFTLLFPIVITLIFLSFPSGLQLYWFAFNILSLSEYFIFQRETVKVWKK